MSTSAEERAALAVGVVAAADATGVTGVFYRATLTTSSTPITLPALANTRTVPMAGRWLNIFSKTSALQYAFGKGAAPTLVYDQDVAAGTGHASAGADVPAGQVFPVIIPSGATHVTIIGESGASGKVTLNISEGAG